MPHAPWFKFYAADYMSSPFVQGLDPEQELWYLRLIIASAISEPRGCLPLANSKLWRLAKAPSLEHFEKYAGGVLTKFERDDAAQLYRVPKVIEQNLVASTDLSSKRSEAGKRGAAKRWQSATNNNGNLPLKPMANVKQKIADSDSDSDKKQIPPNPPSGGLTSRDRRNFFKELNLIYAASQGASLNEDDAIARACVKTGTPPEVAKNWVALSYGERTA
jgi:hypothetical protein